MSTLIMWLIFATVGGFLGWEKNRIVSGVIWGTLLGPIGWFVIWLILPPYKK